MKFLPVNNKVQIPRFLVKPKVDNTKLYYHFIIYMHVAQFCDIFKNFENYYPFNNKFCTNSLLKDYLFKVIISN